MKGCVALIALLLIAGCGSAQSPSPRDVVLRPNDLGRGYEYGDDTGCSAIYGTEGDWPRLEPLFESEHPDACDVELAWVWHGTAPYSNGVTSSAFRFGDADGARRAFAVRDDLVGWTIASLSPKEEEPFGLGDEAVFMRGRGLNNPASGVVWRDGKLVSMVVVEPANDRAARELAKKQQRHIEHPPANVEPAASENDPELQLDDPANTLPVYWLGRTFDPPGELPPLELEVANVGGNGPGQSIQLWYAGGVTLDTYTPGDWKRFRRTLLGRLVWDSPCAHKTVEQVRGGRAEIFAGYGEPRRVQRPCPKRPPDRVVAHVYYARVVVVVNLPYCYMCARPTGDEPYNTVEGLTTVVRALRLRP